MRTGMLSKTLSWAMIAQLVLTPAGHAADVGSVLAQTLQQVLGAQQAQLAQMESQMRSTQRRALLDPTTCGTGPCVSEYFPNCRILKDIPNIVEASACERDSLDPANPNDQARFLDALSLVSDYEELEVKYRNYSSESTQALNTGVTCLARASTALERSLIARETEIDTLIREMQDAQNNRFKPALEADLVVIEDSMALLEGNNFKGRKAALSQNSFRFADSFKAAPCNAVFAEAKFDDDGKRGGFNAIQELLQKTVTTPSTAGSGPGNFTAQTFTGDTARTLTAEISRISGLVQSEVRSSGPESLANATAGINDPYGLLGRLSPIMAEQARTNKNFETELRQEAGKYSISDGAKALAATITAANDEDFNNAATAYEQNFNSTCFEQSPNIQKMLSKQIGMRIEGASNAATKSAENSYLAKLQEIINSGSTLAEKQAAIASMPSSRYYMQIPDTIVIPVGNGQVESIGPSQRVTPAMFIDMHIRNCQAQFTSRNGKNASPSEVVAQMRSIRAKYSAYRKELPNKVATAINTRLNSCSDTQQASGSGGLCSAQDLSTASPTFCVSRASNCATKMNGCYAQAQQQVRNVTARRDQARASYNNNINANKAQLMQMYGRLNTILAMQNAAIVNSTPLREALNLPANVNVNFEFDKRTDPANFVKGLDSLEVVNPDTYFNKIKENLEGVKTALKQQRNNIMNGNNESSLTGTVAAAGGITGHINRLKESMRTAEDMAKAQLNKCQQAVRAYLNGKRQMLAQQAQASQESAERLGEFCSNYASIDAAPACNDEFFDDALRAARRLGQQTTGNTARIRSFAAYCRRFSNESQSGTGTSTAPRTFTIADAVRQLNAADRTAVTERTNSLAFARQACGSATYAANNQTCQKFNIRSSSLCSMAEATTFNDMQSSLAGLIASYPSSLSACTTVATDAQKAACLVRLRAFKTEENAACTGPSADSLANEVVSSIASSGRNVANGEMPDQEDIEAEWRRLGENATNGCAAADNSGSNIADSFSQGFQGVIGTGATGQ